MEAIPIRVEIPPDFIAAFISLVGKKIMSSACNGGSGAVPLNTFLMSTWTTWRYIPIVRIIWRSSYLASNPGPPPSAVSCISVNGEFCFSGKGPWFLNAPSR